MQLNERQMLLGWVLLGICFLMFPNPVNADEPIKHYFSLELEEDSQGRERLVGLREVPFEHLNVGDRALKVSLDKEGKSVSTFVKIRLKNGIKHNDDLGNLRVDKDGYLIYTDFRDLLPKAKPELSKKVGVPDNKGRIGSPISEDLVVEAISKILSDARKKANETKGELKRQGISLAKASDKDLETLTESLKLQQLKSLVAQKLGVAKDNPEYKNLSQLVSEQCTLEKNGFAMITYGPAMARVTTIDFVKNRQDALDPHLEDVLGLSGFGIANYVHLLKKKSEIDLEIAEKVLHMYQVVVPALDHETMKQRALGKAYLQKAQDIHRRSRRARPSHSFMNGGFGAGN